MFSDGILSCYKMLKTFARKTAGAKFHFIEVLLLRMTSNLITNAKCYKVRIKFLLPFILCLFLLPACRKEADEQVKNSAISPTPTFTPRKNPEKPEIGMSAGDFYELCQASGERTPKDDTQVRRTEYGLTTTIKLGITEKRKMNGCWGQFYFVNDKLETIHTD